MQTGLSAFDENSDSNGVEVEPTASDRLAGQGTPEPAPGATVAHVRPGDIVWFRFRRCHGHVTTGRGEKPDDPDATAVPPQLAVTLLDGYSPGRQMQVSREALDELAQREHLTVVHSGVRDPAARWGGAYMTRNPAAAVNTCDATPLRPRCPTDQQTLAREWRQEEISGLLEHPLGSHRLGSRQVMKAAWTARRPDGHASALAVVNRPTARVLGGTNLELIRYVSHPDATAGPAGTNNTATWLISRVGRWAALEGYEHLLSYSGVSDNDGSIYQALPFEQDGTCDHDPSSWNNREGRQGAASARAAKQRWRWPLHGTDATRTRRAAARSTAQAGLATYSDAPPVVDRTPAAFALTREEHPTYYDSGRATQATTPTTERVRDLFASTHPKPATAILEESTRDRPGAPKPPAVFGASVDGTLIAALAVAGSPLPKTPVRTARVIGYVARDTPFPANSAAWLLTRAREWATLSGYDAVVTPSSAFAEQTAAVTDARARAGLSGETTVL